MRIFYFSDQVTILLFFIVWPIIQVGGAFIALYLPDRFYNYNKFPYRTLKIEDNGLIYQKIFRVKKWKHLLPDGAKAWKKKGFQKKKLSSFDDDNLNRFLIESCRAELTHIIPILSVWVFFLFSEPLAGIIMVIYSLVSNLPCLIAQRYNRPRIIKLIKNKL